MFDRRFAQYNLEALRANSYPGRVVLVGMSEDGAHMIQASALMGRRWSSRNRRYFTDGKTVFVDLVEPDPKANRDLLVYNAMAELDRHYFVVSNGRQTSPVVLAGAGASRFRRELREWNYENDENSTPRVTAACSRIQRPHFQLSILRAWHGKCARPYWRYDAFPPGFGIYLSAYNGDGSPCPSFRGGPRALPLVGSQEQVTQTLWSALNNDNKVALAVKFIKIQDGSAKVLLRNKADGD